MAGWEVQVGAINLIVADLQRSAGFYQEVFGVRAEHQDDDECHRRRVAQRIEY